MEHPPPETNRLITEKSPYLLQHAGNPVDWYPWGDEAFERAREENKPVFLSIGYSTCHWCHVMAHESFEDPHTATLMNSTFINIKVDREERPDIDKLYMTVCQMLTGSGGWPLTIIMTPEKKPFFAATYIPRETRFGRVGLNELIPRIEEIWTTHRDEVEQSAEQITTSLATLARDSRQGQPTDEILKQAFDNLAHLFDDENGGFGTAPKFPTPQHLLFLLRYWRRTGNNFALTMVEKTLKSMRRGGIYDHIGFGFHRYSVDEKWFLPHFEKMLYDQAMLAIAYIEAYQATSAKEYADTAREIFSYITQHMTSPTGGFYAAEDADSEGKEGKFYLWSIDEIKDILTGEETRCITEVFGLKKDGNFSEEATSKKTGRNIFSMVKTFAEAADNLSVPETFLYQTIQKAREKLNRQRQKRIHPHKDDKILTDWNGLMIAALARGAQALDDSDYLRAAQNAADFIIATMQDPAGRLVHRYRDAESGIRANLDDYAFFIWGLIELYEASFETHYLSTAIRLNTDLLDHFWDEDDGGFFFTPHDGETLIARQKEIFEGALPSGNAVAMWNLLRLGLITANSHYLEKASRIGASFFRSVEQYPAAYTQLMVAFDLASGPSFEVVITGSPRAEDTKKMLRELRSRFVPNKVVILRPAGEERPEIVSIAGFTRELVMIDGKATAYICSGGSCKFPTTDEKELATFLTAAADH